MACLKIVVCVGLVLVASAVCAQDPWQQVVGGSAAVAAGFGDAENTGVGAMVVFDGDLYVATASDTGCEVWMLPWEVVSIVFEGGTTSAWSEVVH